MIDILYLQERLVGRRVKVIVRHGIDGSSGNAVWYTITADAVRQTASGRISIRNKEKTLHVFLTYEQALILAQKGEARVCEAVFTEAYAEFCDGTEKLEVD